MLKFNHYKNCLLNNEIILKSHQGFTSKVHNVYTEDISKTTQSSNDEKDCKRLIELHHILMVQLLEKYAKQSY